MDENKFSIEKYLSSSKKYIFKGKKNNIYKVQEGRITYDVSLKTFKCPCATNFLCGHLIFILKNIFMLNTNVITFLHTLLPQFDEYLKSQSNYEQFNSYLLNIIKTNILDYNCIICYGSMINDMTFPLYQCDICSKFCHKTCINKWHLTQTKQLKCDNTCVYCMK